MCIRCLRLDFQNYLYNRPELVWLNRCQNHHPDTGRHWYALLSNFQPCRTLHGIYGWKTAVQHPAGGKLSSSEIPLDGKALDLHIYSHPESSRLSLQPAFSQRQEHTSAPRHHRPPWAAPPGGTGGTRPPLSKVSGVQYPAMLGEAGQARSVVVYT